MPISFEIHDLGTLGYQAAWDRQLEIHTRVQTTENHPGALLLVEHPPVITIGRHPGAEKHLLAPQGLLKLRGVEVSETDRGGDITFHGPGQLVAYPIIPLNFYHLNLHTYMRFLEQVVIDTLATWNLAGLRSPGATGVWVKDPHSSAADGLAKICAMGIKVRRWVTFHGIALNNTTDLSFFHLINPCGLGRPVTSLQALGIAVAMPELKSTLTAHLQRLLPEPVTSVSD